MQLIPVKGSAFEHMPLMSNRELMDMRKRGEPKQEFKSEHALVGEN